MSWLSGLTGKELEGVKYTGAAFLQMSFDSQCS
jgi:hypothetical protein